MEKIWQNRDSGWPSTKASQTCDDNYRSLKSSIATYFFMTAAILSLLIVWLGSLFSAINSIDIFNLYTVQTSEAYLRYDFIYLFAGLYTILLLIFYVPVQVNRMALEASIPEDGKAGAGAGTPLARQFLSNFMVRFLEIIVAGSPLLAAALQNFFQSLGK